MVAVCNVGGFDGGVGCGGGVGGVGVDGAVVVLAMDHYFYPCDVYPAHHHPGFALPLLALAPLAPGDSDQQYG